MSVLTLNVDEVMRTLSAESSNPFVVHDKEVDIVRFAINSGFADIVLDGQVALRVMYQRPGETEVRAQTLTYYDTDGLHNYYDWQLSQSDLAKNGALMVALCILDISGGEVSEWHTTPCAVRVLSTIHTDDSDKGDDTITPTVKERVAVLETIIQRVASGAPIVVSSTSAMTDTDQIYVLSTDGNWYYHNGTAWVAGGEYGAVSTDTTLTQSGIPADAKKTGDEITDLSESVGDLKSAFNVMEYQNSTNITAWANGWIRPDGSQGNASNICFSTGWLEVPDTFEIVVTVADGYKANLYEYTQKSYSAFVKDVLQTYKSGTFSVLVNHSNVYKFTIMKNDESAFTPATLPDNPVSIVRHKLLSQTTLQGKIDDSINAFATSKYSTNRQLELANEGTATLLYGDYVKSIVPQKIVLQSYIPFYKNDYIVFTAGSVVDMIDVDCYDSNYNIINTITQTGSGAITPFTKISKGYIRVAVYNANSTPITNQNYDGSVVLFKANYNERNYKYKNVTIHTEKGKYDTTADRYGGPVSNWPTGMINKYPIVVSGAKYVVFPQIQSTASKYAVYFRAQDGEPVSETTPTASISNNRVTIPASAYYMDVYIEYGGLYDFDVTIISETDDPYNLLGEKKRIYVNNNNGMVNYLQVDYEKGLYTALCIMLPPNYSYNGERVPLVVWFDGNTNYPQMGSHFRPGKMPGLSYVRDEGFAVAQIFSWGSYMSGKYQYCGYDQPYPTPTCLKCILTGIDYICDRYNVDADNVHIMSKSMGGLISLYFASRPIYTFKSIGMFSPILDMLGLRGRYPDARRAIFEDMGFSGDIDEFADIDFEGDTLTGVPNYYFSQRCCDNTWAQNMPQLAQLNSAWTNLVGDTLNNNFAKSISDSRAWYADIYATGIYNHPEYKKTAKIPVKIWGAVDDDNVQYQAMTEIIAQLQNSGVFAEMSTKQTGGHSAFDVSTQYAQDITTALGITHEDVPIGWIENVRWIRTNTIKRS